MYQLLTASEAEALAASEVEAAVRDIYDPTTGVELQCTSQVDLGVRHPRERTYHCSGTKGGNCQGERASAA